MDAPLLPTKPEIPDHELLRVIGAGSYGEVWLARTVLGVYRAIKVVRRSAFSDSRPFDREFSGLKRFEPISRRHDSLLDILHVGRNESQGYFYCIMELGDDVVGGQQIDPATYQVKTLAGEVARHGTLPLDECIRIGLSISSGLHIMHSSGLVHRDIKPANIVFINGVPKLADIGLVHSLTSVGSLVGTDGYIPPEGPGSVQADIFALGKVLYEISTGNDRQDFPELPDEIRKNPNLIDFSEFNEVLARACEADRSRRYSSVDGLHADLRVLEAGKSVLRLRTLERRARFLSKATLATTAILVIGGLLGWTYYAQYARAKRAKAEQSAIALNYGGRLIEEGNLFAALGWFVDALALDSSNPHRAHTDRTRIASVLRSAPHLAQCWWQEHPVCFADISPDGRHVLAALNEGTIRVIERATGSNVLTLRHENKNEKTSMRTARFNTTGDVVATSGTDNCIKLWSFPEGRLLRVLQHSNYVYGARFTADNSMIVTSCRDGSVVLWDAAKGEVIRFLSGLHRPTWNASFSPAGDRVIAASTEKVAVIWETQSGKILHILPHKNWVADAAFSPDGKWVVTGCNDQKARIWDAATGAPVVQGLPHEKALESVQFSPDGRYLVTSTYAFSVYVWDIRSGEMAASILRHGALAHARFSPDGRFVLSASLDGSVRCWDLFRSFSIQLGPTITANGRRQFSPDGRKVTVSMVDNGSTITNFTFSREITRIWCNPSGTRFIAHDDSAGQAAGFEVETGRLLGMEVPAARQPRDAVQVILADSAAVATVTEGPRLETWDLERRSRLAEVTFPTNVSAIFSPDGGHVAAFSGTNLHLMRTTDLKPAFPPLAHRLYVSCAAFSRDGSKLVTGCKDLSLEAGYARVWNAANGLPLSREMYEADGIVAVVFSPDATRIALGGEDFNATVWDLVLNKAFPPFAHKNQVLTVKFSEDGRWLFTGSLDGTARIWEIETAAPITPSLQHNSPVQRVAFLPERGFLITTAPDGTGTRWNLQPETRSTAELSATSKFLSGMRRTDSDPRGTIQKVLAPYASGDLTNSAPWHRAQAEMAESKGDYSCARYHLSAEIRSAGATPQLLRRLGFAQAMEKDYGAALSTMQKAMEHGLRNPGTIADAGLLEVLLGDGSCRDMEASLSAFPEREVQSTRCAWLVALAKPTATNLAVCVAAAGKSVDFAAKAALLWKLDRAETALEILRTNEVSVTSAAVEAVILASTGKHDRAETAMSAARQRRLVGIGNWFEQVCLDLLDREFNAAQTASKRPPDKPTEPVLRTSG